MYRQPDGSQLRAVRFSFETLEYLLSTVGARRVKVQFLLWEDKESEEKHFALALYANGITTHTELMQTVQRQAATCGDSVEPTGQPFYDMSSPTLPY